MAAAIGAHAGVECEDAFWTKRSVFSDIPADDEVGGCAEDCVIAIGEIAHSVLCRGAFELRVLQKHPTSRALL